VALKKRYQRPSLQRREKLAKVTEQELPVTGVVID